MKLRYLILLLALSQPAFAEETRPAGKELLKYCEIALDEETRTASIDNAAYAGQCFGFIVGMFEGMAKSHLLCSEPITTKTLVMYIVEELKENPQLHNIIWRDIVYISLIKKFSC